MKWLLALIPLFAPSPPTFVFSIEGVPGVYAECNGVVRRMKPGEELVGDLVIEHKPRRLLKPLLH